MNRHRLRPVFGIGIDLENPARVPSRGPDDETTGPARHSHQNAAEALAAPGTPLQFIGQ
jgi:hypothetical protein